AAGPLGLVSPRLTRIAPRLGLLAVVACEADQPVPQPRDCGEVRCEGAGVQLDPSDCQCKCGAPARNLVCAADQACVDQGGGSYGCVSVLCTAVPCQRGMSCDPLSGRCACGSGPAAPVCESWQACGVGRCTREARGVGGECGASGACDPADGACRCGEGPACEGPASCVGEAGAERCETPCAGVQCPEGTVCNEADALCHCGSADRPAC